MTLKDIKKANDIKKLKPEEYDAFAEEIRQFLIENISKSGGHLASNLGVVELTMALHLSFRLSNIDLPPMGNLAETMLTLVNGAPEKPEFLLEYAVDGDSFEFDTRQIRQALGGVPLDTPEVLIWMRDYLQEGIEAAGKLP